MRGGKNLLNQISGNVKVLCAVGGFRRWNFQPTTDLD